MKHGRNSKKVIALLSALLLVSVWTMPAMAAAPKVYKMSGKITAVDLKDNTVVVDVPMGKKEIYTVAGPLAQDAVLKKGNKTATLKDFQKGESVIVEWEVTDKGHIVKQLIAK